MESQPLGMQVQREIGVCSYRVIYLPICLNIRGNWDSMRPISGVHGSQIYMITCVCTYVCMCVHKKKSIIMDTSVPDIGAAVLIINTISHEHTLRIALVVVPPKILFVIAINIPSKRPQPEMKLLLTNHPFYDFNTESLEKCSHACMGQGLTPWQFTAMPVLIITKRMLFSLHTPNSNFKAAVSWHLCCKSYSTQRV